MKKARWMRRLTTLGVSVLFIAGCAAAVLLPHMEAKAETTQAGPAPSGAATSSNQVYGSTKLTPEQEAALVEARTILQEASQVAERIALPNKLFSNATRRRGLEEVKTRLQYDIETAQLRAGDFSAAGTTKDLVLLALAQARYGRTQDAVQTASRTMMTEAGLLAIVDALITGGNLQAALAVLETQLQQVPGAPQRNQKRAQVLSFIAGQQAKSGDPAAKETLQSALNAANAIVDPSKPLVPDSSKAIALMHVAQAQLELGDRSASVETFRRAVDAALSIQNQKKDGTSGTISVLRQIAYRQAESGDQAGSGETFKLLIDSTESLEARSMAFTLGKTACDQVVSGHRAAGMQTFQQALRAADSLSTLENAEVISKIGKWKLKAGEREAVAEAIQRLRQAGWVQGAISLAIDAKSFQEAMELTRTMSDEWMQVISLEQISRALLVTKDSFGTKKVFQELLALATALSKKEAPMDRVKANSTLASIALVKVAAGEIPSALQTADTISFEERKIRTYADIIRLLILKGELRSAKSVAVAMREEWLPWSGSIKSLQDLANASVKNGEISEALAWAGAQENPYAQAASLLGVGVALLEQQDLPNLFEQMLVFGHRRMKCDYQ